LFALTALLWIALLVRNRERIAVPAMFWPLAAYAGITLVSTLFSINPSVSLRDDKQLLLFAIVPLAYRLLRGTRAVTAVDVIITVGAVSAAIGIIQFGILKFDDLGQRPRGSLGLYMTYSGQLMLIACLAAARIMFRRQDRMWPALVMPALVVALVTTLSRNAWVGACAGIGLLFLIRDFRLIALVPVLAALFFVFAPAQISDRLWATFQVTQARRQTETTTASVLSNQDRLAMVRSGWRIIKDHPLTGVGPDMLIQVYPGYRDRKAVSQLNPHLHNVPLQIAAERGLPALAIWLWFVITLIRDFIRQRRVADAALRFLPNAGLACVAAMLAAGLFEHNFGDSEFLMLFLLIVTLPYAALRHGGPARVSA
ncbi:MAG TPA: O-antigen ligase family protein, partial [Vicinamibacterales bacterium]|nr:O-antigen ligase family protein [Vicinamibacterales bacterium]